MARIGDYIDPSLNRYDPSPYLQAQGNATRTIGAGISNAIGDFGDKLKEQREKKNEVKANSKLIESYMTLYPDAASALGPIKDALADEDLPVSERYAISKQTGDMIAAYLGERESAADREIQRQQLEMDSRRLGIAEAGAARDAEQFNFTMGQAKEADAVNKAVQGAVAPSLLEQAINTARSIEQSGGRSPIDPEVLQRALQTGTPEEQLRIASAFEGLILQPEKPEFRDINVKIDGVDSVVTAAYNPATGSFDVVPVNDGTGGGDLRSSLPAPLAPYASAFEAAGRKYGIDPKFLAAISIHETGGGTSPAFRQKNNAMGISNDSGPTVQESVEASIEKMARELTKPGGYYDGKNTIGAIGATYAPIGAGNDPRGLNKSWPKGVAQYYKQLGGNPSASVRITPGAAKGAAAAKTPTEQAIDEARLKKLDAEVQNKDADLDKQKDAKATAKAAAENALTLIEQLRNHPGFKGAVGMSLTPKWIPATDRKGAEAIIDQLKGQAFLTAIQQLRGLGALSDAEGAKLQQAAVRLDASQSEKDFKAALSDYENQIREALGRLGGDPAASPSAPTESSAAAKLRALRGQ